MDINTWLNSPFNYEAGVKLYELHGSSDFLKKMFARGETAFNRQKLYDEMKQLAVSVFQSSKATAYTLPERAKEVVQSHERQVNADQTRTDKGEQRTENPVQHVATLPKPVNEYPPEIQALINKAVGIHNQAGRLHRELRLNKRILSGMDERQWPYLTKVQRRENALLIVDLARENRRLWRQIDLFQKTGEIPSAKAKEQLPESILELQLLRKKLAPNVSKWKKKTEQAKDPDRKKECEKKFALYANKLAQIDKKLTKYAIQEQ